MAGFGSSEGGDLGGFGKDYMTKADFDAWAAKQGNLGQTAAAPNLTTYTPRYSQPQQSFRPLNSWSQPTNMGYGQSPFGMAGGSGYGYGMQSPFMGYGQQMYSPYGGMGSGFGMGYGIGGYGMQTPFGYGMQMGYGNYQQPMYSGFQPSVAGYQQPFQFQSGFGGK